MKHSNHPNGFIIGAVVGSVLGAMATMLFTTDQGKKVKHEAMKRYHDFEGVAKKLIQTRYKNIARKHRHKKRK